MKKMLLCLSLLMAMGSTAYTQTRAVSKPGRISNPYQKKTITPVRTTGHIDCALEYTDPSGDAILTQGETGRLTVRVTNNSSTAIKPKLNITYKASWMSSSKSMIKWMNPIDPGNTGKWQTNMKWDKRLPSGSIEYQVSVSDESAGLQSGTEQLAFQVQSLPTAPPAQPMAPVFVDVDKNIPKTWQHNAHAIAVIIGNKDYIHNDIPDVDYAVNDARIVKEYLMNMMGYKAANIIYIENADKAAFEQTFGTHDYHQGKLFNFVRPNQSDVFIYYSGHGAPDMNNRKAYFMPVNCDPNYVRIDGYSLDLFYKNLAKVPAKSMNVVLDACFSGGSQSGMLIQKASPMFIDVKMPLLASNKVNLITSASGSQISSWYPEGNHSLFTYYYLRGLRGEADANNNRSVTLMEMKQYLNNNVPYAARRKYAREQTPVVKGNMASVLIRY